MSGVARDDRGTANGSMGLDAADYNRSGRASLFVTNYENELPALYKNDATGKMPQFSYDTLASGIAAIGGKYVSWGHRLLRLRPRWLGGHPDRQRPRHPLPHQDRPSPETRPVAQ